MTARCQCSTCRESYDSGYRFGVAVTFTGYVILMLVWAVWKLS